ncbi:MFS transporter [Chloroflexota bacterium]
MSSKVNINDRFYYGWVIVASLFMICVILYGIHFSFGLFFKSIESEFNLTRTATSAVVSANFILAGISSVWAGWASDKYGPRIVFFFMGLFTGTSLLLTSQTNSFWQLFITYSLLLSMGTGAIYVMLASTVSRWFNRKRGLALGLAGAGTGIGTMIMAPFATYVIITLGWRMSYLVVGLIAWIVVIPLAWLFKREPREIGGLPNVVNSNSRGIETEENGIGAATSSLMGIAKRRSFWLLIFVWLFFGSYIFLIFTHLVPHITDIGFSAGKAAQVVSLIGLGAIIGRVLMGIVADKIGRKKTTIITSLLSASVMLWLIWSQELWMLLSFGLAFGFAYGGFSSSSGALVSDIFGLHKIGAIFGVLEFGFGIGAAIGSAMGGIIFDVSNNYTISFLIGAVTMLIAAFLIALTRREVIDKRV